MGSLKRLCSSSFVFLSLLTPLRAQDDVPRISHSIDRPLVAVGEEVRFTLKNDDTVPHRLHPDRWRILKQGVVVFQPRMRRMTVVPTQPGQTISILWEQGRNPAQPGIYLFQYYLTADTVVAIEFEIVKRNRSGVFLRTDKPYYDYREGVGVRLVCLRRSGIRLPEQKAWKIEEHMRRGWKKVHEHGATGSPLALSYGDFREWDWSEDMSRLRVLYDRDYRVTLKYRTADGYWNRVQAKFWMHPDQD